MRRILALSSLVLFACARESAPDAGPPASSPTKLVFEAVEHTEDTEDFHEAEPWPQSAPLAEAQQGLVSLAKERFFELAAAEHLPRGCDDSAVQVQTLSADRGMLLVTFQLRATADEWTGEGCCTPCATPCVPGSCGYCSPADSCQHFATRRVLRVSFQIDAGGRVYGEQLARQVSERQLVPAEVVVAFRPFRPEVQIIEVEAPGAGGDREKLNAYVKSRKAALVGCYQRALRRNPSVLGTINVQMVITPAGRTAGIELEENMAGGAAVGSCLQAVMRGWVFPFKPEVNVPVVLRLAFTPVPL